MQASRSSASTSVAYILTQLDLDARSGSILLLIISIKCNLFLTQAARSRAYTSVAYTLTQLDLDASGGSISMLVIDASRQE